MMRELAERAFDRLVVNWIINVIDINLIEYLENYFGFGINEIEFDDRDRVMLEFKYLTDESKNDIIKFFKENPDKLIKLIGV